MGTPNPPQVAAVGGDLTAADAAAAALLGGYQAGRLTGAHSRAANWTAGLTAATGVVGTATVVNGPATFADLASPYQWIVLIAAVVAALGLLAGIYYSYRAAYGEDTEVAALAADVQRVRQPGGLAADLTRAANEDADRVRRDAKRARDCVGTAVAAILVATLASWLPEEAKTEICTQEGTRARTETVSTSEPGIGSTTTTTITCIS